MPSDRRNVSAAITHLNPDDIPQRSFSSAFRGLDPVEVRDYLARLADELRAAAQREEALQVKLANAEERASTPPTITEEMVTAFLGQETARILKSAHDAANDVRAKAEAVVEAQRAEMRAEIEQLREQADRYVEERRRDVEAAAAELRESASLSAESTREVARAESEALIEQAKQTGRQLVRESQELRAKILGDLARRRAIAHAQVEQLRAGRERLLDAYKVVRESFDSTASDLERAESEARAAAEAAARRVAEEPEISAEDFEAALGAAAQSELGAIEGLDSAPGEEGLAEVIDLDTEGGEVSDEPTRTSTGLRIVGRSRAARREQPRGESAPATSTSGSGSAGETTDLSDEGVTVIHSATASTTGEPVAEHPSGQSSRSSGDVLEARDESIEQTSADQIEVIAEEAEQAADSVAVEAAESLPKVKAKAASLFARMKAERAKAIADETPAAPDEKAVVDSEVETAAPVEEKAEVVENKPAPKRKKKSTKAEAAEVVAEAPVVEAEPTGEEVDADSDVTAATAERDEVLEPLRKSMTRLLKRTLQDEQNDVLNRLRLQKGKVNVSALSEEDEQRGRYRRAIEKTIRIAMDHGAGQSGFAVKAEAEFTRMAGENAEELAATLSSGLTARLHEGVSLIIEEGGDDVERRSMDSVSAVYREWKNQRVENLVGDGLAAAYANGFYLATPDGTPLAWVVDSGALNCEPCKSNGAAGLLERGKPFPSGQVMPAAHPSCRCSLALTEA